MAALPVNRAVNDTVDNNDINAIATAVNANTTAAATNATAITAANNANTANANAIVAALLITPSIKTASYTLVLADGGECVEMNSATATTVSIPLNSAVAFPIGTVLSVVQIGTGQVTIASVSGVTVQTSSSLTTRAQYSEVTLRKRLTDTWVVSGDLT